MSKVHLPIVREDRFGRIPWGYTEVEPGSLIIVPIKEQLDVLEKAFDYLDEGASFQKTADWVGSKCGVSIAHTTLKNRYESDPGRDEGRKKRAKLVENYSANNANKRRKHKDEAVRLAIGIGHVKKSLTAKEKRLAKLKESKAVAEAEAAKSLQDSNKILPVVEQPASNIEVESVPAEVKPEFIIRPNEGPQTDFLAAAEKEILYGGAAGGGKSFALIIDPLRTVHLESHRAITFRRTNDELRELIGMTKEIYPKVVPGAKFLEQKSTWVFPNGGTHWYRYLDRDDDVHAMQGQSFTWIGFDELTHWPTPFVYDYLRSRLRSKDPVISQYLFVRSTSNPGGPGHQWVKKMFIDPAPFNTAFPATDIETGEKLLYPKGHAKEGQPLFYRRFIPAYLKDNPYLYTDGNYETQLLSLTEAKRKQLLEGNWDIVEGAAFPEFDRQYHVCEPFPIPDHWAKFRACDWGFDQPHCVLWFAVEPYSGRLYVYRELYGRKVVSSDLADKILSAENGERISYGVLDSHAFDMRDGSTSPGKTMISRGCLWRPAANRAPNSRKTTKQEVHRRLQVVDTIDQNTKKFIKVSGLVIFNTCVNLIRTLPSLPSDKNDPEDVDTDAEDHQYDSLRYGCASRPMYTRPVSTFNNISVKPSKQYDAFGFPA